MKTCSSCRLTKPLNDFYLSKTKNRPNQTHRCQCKDCTKTSYKTRYASSPETFRQRSKEWKQKNLDKVKTSKKLYYHLSIKTDPIKKLKHTLRKRFRSFIKQRAFHKDNSCISYLGCTLDDLKTHLERQFQEGMSWENHGQWHIDHIVPLNSAQTEQDIYRLCHFQNLQPLWAKDNLIKGSKWAR